jgi:hypothetical protein
MESISDAIYNASGSTEGKLAMWERFVEEQRQEPNVLMEHIRVRMPAGVDVMLPTYNHEPELEALCFGVAMVWSSGGHAPLHHSIGFTIEWSILRTEEGMQMLDAMTQACINNIAEIQLEFVPTILCA